MAPYNYETNQEFIDDTYGLLKKLKDKNLINKNTGILCLDKSVRPLAYTLRKEIKELGLETPDFKFINYSRRDENSEEKRKKLEKEIQKKMKKNYNNIIILDEYSHTGESLNSAVGILRGSSQQKEPFIHFATLKASPNSLSSQKELMANRYSGIDRDPVSTRYSEKELEKMRTEEIKKLWEESKEIHDNQLEKATNNPNTYIMYQKKEKDLPPEPSSRTGIEDTKEIYSQRTSDKETYKKFIQNRKKLSKDIKKYINELPEEEKPSKSKNNGLENLVKLFPLGLLIVGLLFSYNGITGNIISSNKNLNISSIIGVMLIVASILFYSIKKIDFKN